MDIGQSQLGLVNDVAARGVTTPSAALARRASGQQKNIENDVAPSNTVDTQELAEQANAFLKSRNANVEFQVDSGSGRTVLRIIDSQSKEVLRQIPSEELLAISRSLDRLRGLLLRSSA